MDEQPKKKRPGRWKKGESGNIAGKPKGSGKVQQLREALGQRLPEIMETVVAQAISGDMVAARIVLERVLPALRPAEQPVALEMPKGGTLTQQAQAVLTAAADGALGLGQAAQLIAAIATVGKVAEVDELEARIRVLEEQHGSKS